MSWCAQSSGSPHTLFRVSSREEAEGEGEVEVCPSHFPRPNRDPPGRREEEEAAHRPRVAISAELSPAIPLARPFALVLLSHRYPWKASEAQRPYRLMTSTATPMW